MAEKKHWRDAMHDRNKDWMVSREKPKGGAWEGGKGHASRVTNTSAYRDNWDRIFGTASNQSDEDMDSGTRSTEKPTE